jgi:hypothetical protein
MADGDLIPFLAYPADRQEALRLGERYRLLERRLLAGDWTVAEYDEYLSIHETIEVHRHQLGMHCSPGIKPYGRPRPDRTEVDDVLAIAEWC